MSLAPERPRTASRSFRSDRRAWAVFVILGLVVVLSGRAWLNRTVVSFAELPGGSVDDFRLAVLAYDRVAAQPDGRHIHATQLAEHVAWLREAGFTPVTLAQIGRAFRERGGLPEKSVLLTFDSGYLSTYAAADPLLRRLRWPAVMLLDTRHQMGREPGFLYWDRLGRMVKSGIWEVGVHGPIGAMAEPEAASQDVATAWLTGRRTLEERLPGHRVLAYAPRVGAGWPADLGPQEFELGFAEGTLAVNSRSNDPRRLVRVRVDPTWSGKQLVERLTWAATSPAATGHGAEMSSFLRRWVTRAGRATIDGEALLLGGDVRSEARLAGSRWSSNWILEAKILVDADEFWVTQSGLTESSGWRWGGTRDALYLQVFSRDEVTRVLVRRPRTAPGPPGEHALRIIRRGVGVWIEWDGEPVASTPFVLPKDLHGDLGFVVAGTSGPAHLRVSSLRFDEVPFLVEPLSPKPSTARIQSLIRAAPRLAAISPILLERSGSGFTEHRLDRDLLAMLAHRYGWEILPTVVASGSPATLDPSFPVTIAERLAREAWSGLRLDVSRLDSGERDAWNDVASSWTREFSRRGLRLVVASAAKEGGARP